MRTFKYVLKRIGLMFFTLWAIFTLCFIFIKMLEPTIEIGSITDEIERLRRQALGLDKPVMEQYFIYLKNIITRWDWGTSWKFAYLKPTTEIITERMLPTIIVNFYSFIVAVPAGILLGVYISQRKDKWQDHIYGVLVIIFISLPSFVDAFFLQFLFVKLGWTNIMVEKVANTGGWLTWKMFVSMLLPILAMALPSIAALSRRTRAELIEQLTSDYMLLARAKGLTQRQATMRHGLKNAMVPLLPGIIGGFIGMLYGSLIIEQIFGIPGVGALYVSSITLLDYDLFMTVSMFYAFIGLSSSIITDLSYGFLDPTIQMGAGKQ